MPDEISIGGPDPRSLPDQGVRRPDHWTVVENFEAHSVGVFLPGQYRAKNLKHEPGVYEMTDLVPMAERDELRAGISWARGLCSDQEPHEVIDHFLGCVLAGKAQLPGPDQEACEGWTATRWAENAAYWRDQAVEKNAALVALEAERDRLRETIREAAGNLCMTQCPAYTDNGVCASGCYSEPSCQTDEPTEGWIVAALNLLVPDEDESADGTDEEKAT